MRFAAVILLSSILAGCVSNPVYNAPQAPAPEVTLNDSGFKAIQEGMTMTQVHQAMGAALTIGYEFKGTAYQPVTVPNPYRTEAVKGTDYVIEYYIEAVRQPDGVVSDDELMPLVFKDGKLVGRGWPLANSLHSGHLPV